MTREVQSLFALNRGVVSRLGLARMDIKRLSMAAEMQTNWMPRVLGSMSVRPGLKYIGGINNNASAKFLKFIFATDDTALIELTDSNMRIWMNDALLTRPTVSTTIPALAAPWTDADEGSAASTVAGTTLKFVGTGTDKAIRKTTVTCTSPNIEHGIRIVISRGPIFVRIGSSDGTDDYLHETSLETGTHSFSITPTADFYIRFFSANIRESIVASCAIEAAGVLSIPTPWVAASLSDIRYDQSADVLFLACAGQQQMKIERRGERPNARSWSIVKYEPNDGPFKIQNITKTTLACSVLDGNGTLTASEELFNAEHVGSLFSISSIGQEVTKVSSASGEVTTSIRVTGVDADRIFVAEVSGCTASTITLERSFDDLVFVPTSKVYIADIAESIDDNLDNQIVYYRLKLTARVAPDTVTMRLSFSGGSIRGIVRVTGVTNETTASVEVLSSLGGLAASENWQEGEWSDKNGWPTAVKLHEGRLWWAGINGIWGSVSDAFDSFDEVYPGAAGTINRTIGSGPVDVINWMLSLKGLLVGAQGMEYTIRASSLDEPLTPMNFNVKTSSSQGSGNVDAIKVDNSGYFVNRSSAKVFDLSFDIRNYDYSSTNLMELAPEIGLPGIVRMDVQRLPDTRLHCVRSDGVVVIAVANKAEEVLAWIQFETDGYVEDVVTLPALDGYLDEQVYYVVKRSINGGTVRYLEKWAQEIDCRGGNLNCIADSYIHVQSSAKTISGLGHLEGEEVVVWADGFDIGTNDSSATWTQSFKVSGGLVTLPASYTNVVVGLGYTAKFKSAKLGGQQGTTLNMQKRSAKMGLVSAYMHPRGIRFGADFDHLDDMPRVEEGYISPSSTRDTYDYNTFEFPGVWTTDLRLCVQGQAPRPATVLAVTMDLVMNP